MLNAVRPNDPATAAFGRNIENHEYLWDAARQVIYERLHDMPWLHQSEHFARLAAIIGNLSQLFDHQSYSLENRDRWLCGELEQAASRVETERAASLESLESERLYWKSEQRILLNHAPEMDRIVTELIAVRNEKAHRSGSDTFADLCLRRHDSLEYTAHDLGRLAEAVLDSFAPAARDVHLWQGEMAEIRRWRPWTDSEIDFVYPEQINRQEVLELRVEEFLERLSPDFRALFHDNRQRFLLDLFNREEKFVNPFVSSFTRPDRVFLSTNLDGTATSLTEVFHETAHLIESFAALSQTNYYYRNSPPETSEAIALATELIATRHYDLFYGDEVNDAALLVIGEHITMLVDYARETLFELWLYQEGGEVSAKVRADKWNELVKRGGSLIDWEGCEKYQQVEYLDDLSRYLTPFNSAKYLVGAVASFQIYLNYLRDPAGTAHQILDTMSAGDSQHLTQLFEKLGVPFRFDPLHISGLSQRMSEVWDDAKNIGRIRE